MQSVKLYDGKVEIEFDPDRHIYKRDGKNLISVTAATGMIDKSRPLMFWCINLAKDFLFKNMKALVNTSEEDVITALIEEAGRQHTIFKKKAADIGTLVHEWVESYLKGEDPDLPEDKKALNGVNAFLKWFKDTHVKIIKSEEIVYSKKYDYVGKLDLEAKIDGKYSIVDFKTSSGIYDEMRYQRAGYQQAKEEMTGRTYKDGYIVQFNKDTGNFNALKIPVEDQKKDIKAFLGALELKRRAKELSKF